MSNSANQTSDHGPASDALNSSHPGTDLRPRQFVFLPDSDGASGSWYLESNPNTPMSDIHQSSEQPLVLDTFEPEYSETSTPARRQRADQTDHPRSGQIDKSGSFEGSSNASQHSSDDIVSDVDDTDRSGDLQAESNASSPDPPAAINQSFLPDMGEARNTRIEMESSQTLETGHGLNLPDVGETQNTESLARGPAHSEVGANNNLFFRTDSGRILAIRISPTLGPELLRGLSHQVGPMTELPALPFVSTSSTTFNGGLASDAHDLPLTANASAQRSSSAFGSDRIAGVSSSASAPVPRASAAFGSKLRPTSGIGIVNTDAWVHGIFASADGKPYDRDWMSKHSVNDDILEGIPSKHKLDTLVRHGAVIVGDKLCVTYHSSGNPLIIEGEVLPGSTSTDLRVRIAPSRARFSGILRNVQGPRDLISGMNKEYAARYGQAVPEQWKAVRLTSSTGQELGTLFEVRQAYQVWADEQAKWAACRSWPLPKACQSVAHRVDGEE